MCQGLEVEKKDNNDHLVQSSDPDHPANMIPDLCRKFYNWGWVTGTGGGVSAQHFSLARHSRNTPKY